MRLPARGRGLATPDADCAHRIPVESEDGEIGHVEDVLVDDTAWSIRHLVVDAEKRCSDKSLLVSPEWLTRATLAGRTRCSASS